MRWLLFMVIASLCLVACGGGNKGFSVTPPMPTQTFSPCPTCSQSTTPGITPTPTIEPFPSSWIEPTGRKFVLPAPLYYVSTHTMEQGYSCYTSHIVRIERDGQTRSLISPCFTKVRGFDISPIDATVAMITDGRLWLTDKNGDNGGKGEKAKLLAVSLPDPEGANANLFQMQSPAWSPDGSKIVYSDGGIRIVDVATGQRQDIIESSCNEIGFASGTGSCFYGTWYLAPKWSPDSNAILFKSQNADYFYQMTYNLSAQDKPERVIGTMCVNSLDIAWSPDSKFLYLDDWWPYDEKITTPAFIQVTRNNLDAHVLWSHGDRADPIYASGGNNPWQARYPFVESDGKIMYFQAQPCDSESCYRYDLIEGSVTSNGFNQRTIRSNALPDNIDYLTWHESGDFIAFSAWSNSHEYRYIAVMEVPTGKILFVASDKVQNDDTNPNNLVWGRP